MLPDLRVVTAAVVSTFFIAVSIGFYTSSRLMIETRHARSESFAPLDEAQVKRAALNWPDPFQQAEPIDLSFAVTAKAARNPVRDVTETASMAEAQPVSQAAPQAVASDQSNIRQVADAVREAAAADTAVKAPENNTATANVVVAALAAKEPEIAPALPQPALIERAAEDAGEKASPTAAQTAATSSTLPESASPAIAAPAEQSNTETVTGSITAAEDNPKSEPQPTPATIAEATATTVASLSSDETIEIFTPTQPMFVKVPLPTARPDGKPARKHVVHRPRYAARPAPVRVQQQAPQPQRPSLLPFGNLGRR